MHVARPEPLGLVLRTGHRVEGEPPADAADRRRVHAAPGDGPAADGPLAAGPGHAVNVKRVSRLMRVMGIAAIYPKPRLSRRCEKHPVFPYLLRGVRVERVDQVWSTDITYVPMRKGFMYLAAVIDWHSRYVLGWRLSNTLDGTFCVELLDEVLRRRKPEVFNTDQGVQFTAREFVGRLERAGVAISMDGKGRALDNVFVERLWRTVKYEHLYVMGYETVPELERGLKEFLRYYNRERMHQGLNYQTPANVYKAGQARFVGVGRERPQLGCRTFAADPDEAAGESKRQRRSFTGSGGRDYSDRSASRGTENGDHLTQTRARSLVCRSQCNYGSEPGSGSQ